MPKASDDRDAAIVADLLSGLGTNEIVRKHHCSKSKVVDLRRVAKASVPVHAAVPVPRYQSVPTPEERAINLAGLIVEHIQENFRAQGAILRLVQNEEWLGKHGAIEVAELYERLSSRTEVLLDTIRPNE